MFGKYKKLYEQEYKKFIDAEHRLFQQTVIESCQFCCYAEPSHTYKKKVCCKKQNSPTYNRVCDKDFKCRNYAVKAEVNEDEL